MTIKKKYADARRYFAPSMKAAGRSEINTGNVTIFNKGISELVFIYNTVLTDILQYLYIFIFSFLQFLYLSSACLGKCN